MVKPKNLSLNIRGYLMDLDIPKVMGILNVTPDSFYSYSRNLKEKDIRARVSKMIEEGVDIIDIGGCSTRPGFEPPSPEEEWERIYIGCSIVKEIGGDLPLSIDTYRAEIARKAIDFFNVDIINDISGAKEPDMMELIAAEKMIYVLTHNPENCIEKNVTASSITWLSKKINELHRFGINDVIIDPGFGFAKTIEENFQLLKELDSISEIGLPVLVGLSRKSMIYKTLGCTPEESLVGTVALDAIALAKGADILRVHDVKEAVETIKLFSHIKN